MSVAREQPPVERIVRPFQDFARKQSTGGVLLIVATAVALAWANSPWGEGYAALWHTKLTVGVGRHRFLALREGHFKKAREEGVR